MVIVNKYLIKCNIVTINTVNKKFGHVIIVQLFSVFILYAMIP